MERITSGRILSLALLASLLGGCLSARWIAFDPTRAPSRADPPTLLAATTPFEPLTPLRLRLEPLEIDRRHSAHRFETASAGRNRQPGNRLGGRYYRAHGTAPRPLVLVLPIWGASDYPQRATLRHLRRHPVASSYHLLTLDGERYLFDWLALRRASRPEEFLSELRRSVEAFEVTVRDVRRLLRWAAARPEVDSRRIALVGFSIGAILGADVLAFEPRLRAGGLIMGGGNLHEILATCPRRPGRARRNMLELTGWSIAEYESEIEPILAPVDPVRYAPAVDPGRVLFVDAGADRCIPETGRDALWNALGRPERLTLPLNHRASFLTMTPLLGHRTTRRLVDFVVDRLERADTHTPVAVAGGGD